MNAWRFPQGTKLWKEFTVGNVRVETRFYAKLGPTESDWYQVAFVWNAAQNTATAAPNGQVNANGTNHDVPSRATCRSCHDRSVGRVLGFSALQLDVPAPAGDLDLADLVQLGLLSNKPVGTASPFFPLPPDATPADTAYLHANCGHCHHEGNDDSWIGPDLLPVGMTRLSERRDDVHQSRRSIRCPASRSRTQRDAGRSGAPERSSGSRAPTSSIQPPIGTA